MTDSAPCYFLHCNTIFNSASYHTEIAYCSCLLLLLLTACRPAKEHLVQRAASQKALSRLQFLWSPLLGGIIGAELLFNSSLPLDSQCPSQKVKEAFADRLFNSYSAHPSTNFQIFTAPACSEFQRNQRIFKALLLFCISGAWEAQQTLSSFSVLWQDFKHGRGGGIFSLSLFAKLTESFLTEVSQTVLSRNSSLPQVSTWKVRNWSNFNQLKRKSGRDWGRLGPYGTTPFPHIIPLLLRRYREPSLEFLIH